MQLQKAIHGVLLQLSESLDLVSQEQYATPCSRLGGSSVGRHVRHVIEMFQCLFNGYDDGLVDYEKRERNRQVEMEKQTALDRIGQVLSMLGKPDKPLCLLAVYDDPQQPGEIIHTNFYRELVYNLEHTIHHMALIRIGMNELGNFPLRESYGVAFSTVKHNNECAR